MADILAFGGRSSTVGSCCTRFAADDTDAGPGCTAALGSGLPILRGGSFHVVVGDDHPIWADGARIVGGPLPTGESMVGTEFPPPPPANTYLVPGGTR